MDKQTQETVETLVEAWAALSEEDRKDLNERLDKAATGAPDAVYTIFDILGALEMDIP